MIERASQLENQVDWKASQLEKQVDWKASQCKKASAIRFFIFIYNCEMHSKVSIFFVVGI